LHHKNFDFNCKRVNVQESYLTLYLYQISFYEKNKYTFYAYLFPLIWNLIQCKTCMWTHTCIIIRMVIVKLSYQCHQFRMEEDALIIYWQKFVLRIGLLLSPSCLYLVCLSSLIIRYFFDKNWEAIISWIKDVESFYG